MQYRLNKADEKAFIKCINGIVVEINGALMKLTGYSEDELAGRSIIDVYRILKISSQINTEEIYNECSCYLFNKQCNPREVDICCTNYEKGTSKYTFREKPHSRIEQKLDWALMLLSHNKTGGAIYSAPEGILLAANDKFFDYYARTSNITENIIGSKLENNIINFKGSIYENIFKGVIKNGTPHYSDESRFISPKGEETFWTCSLIPISVSGKVKYIVHTVNDITERVFCKRLMEEKNRQMEAIIENISDRLYLADIDYNVQLLNQNSERSFIGIDAKDLTEFKKSPSARILNGERLKNERYTINKPEGTYNYSISGSPIYNEHGKIEKAIICASDITDLIKSQQAIALEHQYGLLNSMVENLCLGCIKISYPEFQINYVNNEASHYITGLNSSVDSVDSIFGRTPFEILDYRQEEISDIKDNIKKLIAKREGNYILTKKIVIAGREKFMKIIYQPLFDLNYNVTELVSFAVDVTDEVQAKKKIEKALKTQDDIFANVAHELKTPLNVIFSANQLMELYLNNESLEKNIDRFSRSINIVKQNCYRFTKLINNIVDLSKMDSGFFKLNLANENIVQLVENIVQSVSEYVARKGIDIVFDTNTEEYLIAVDSDKIERIMLNLISNAIKFTNSGGNILVNVVSRVSAVEISVMDTGTGIEKKNLNSIFDRFYQVDKSLSRNTEGSGIGLSLVKSIVELHGGKITADSWVGEGSIFKIELPGRLVQEKQTMVQSRSMDKKIEMINIEFSDIYSM